MCYYHITSVQSLTDWQKEDIWKLLILADREFVPPLSERSSTLQNNLKSVASEIDIKPRVYFNNLLQQKFLLVLQEEKVIAFMSYIPDHRMEIEGQENFVADYISTVIVHPEYRGQGITKSLYQHLIHQKQNGYIATRTWSTNYAHSKILESMDFKTIHIIQNDRGEGIDTVYYCKKR